MVTLRRRHSSQRRFLATPLPFPAPDTLEEVLLVVLFVSVVRPSVVGGVEADPDPEEELTGVGNVVDRGLILKLAGTLGAIIEDEEGRPALLEVDDRRRGRIGRIVLPDMVDVVTLALAGMGTRAAAAVELPDTVRGWIGMTPELVEGLGRSFEKAERAEEEEDVIPPPVLEVDEDTAAEPKVLALFLGRPGPFFF